MNRAIAHNLQARAKVAHHHPHTMMSMEVADVRTLVDFYLYWIDLVRASAGTEIRLSSVSSVTRPYVMITMPSGEIRREYLPIEFEPQP